MDDVTWGALAFALTVLGGVYTWWAFRHRGAAAGLRGLALTLLPPAAWLTGTLGMFTQIVRAVSSWATHLVLSPTVWAGIAAAGTSVLLWLVATGLDRWRPVEGRRPRREVTGRDRTPRTTGSKHGSTDGGAGPPAPTTEGDDDFADIEALLRRKGIE